MLSLFCSTTLNIYNSHCVIFIIHSNCFRLSPLTTPPVEKSPIMNLTLQEILIVGNCNDQVKQQFKLYM